MDSDLASNARPGDTLTHAPRTATYRGAEYASEAHVIANSSKKAFKLFWKSGSKPPRLHSTIDACSTAQIGAAPALRP